MYAGVFCAIAFIAAWMAIFVPYFVTNRSKILRTLLVTIAGGVVPIAPVTTILTAPLIFTLIFVLAVVAIGGVEIVTLFMPSRRTFLPAFSGFYALFTVPATWNLGKIAYRMWADAIEPGGDPYGEDFSLAGIHLLLILMFLILTVILWFRLYHRVLPVIRMSTIASGLFIMFASISFFYTIPRYGSEGTILWLFLVPGFIWADIVLLISCVLILIIHHGHSNPLP